MNPKHAPRRPDYVVGMIDRITGEKRSNIGGGWAVEQGRIRVRLNVVIPVGQVVVLFPNKYRDEPDESTERCDCNPPTTSDEVPDTYHDDCEGVR